MEPQNRPIKLSLKKGKLMVLNPIELAQINGGIVPDPPSTDPKWLCILDDVLTGPCDPPTGPSPNAGTC